MPDKEQLGILCLFGLLAVLYVIGLAIKYLVEYWYVVAGLTTGIIAVKVWLRRRYPLHLDDVDDWEPVPQE